MMEGEWKSALEDALKATQLDPSFTKGYLRAGKCYTKLGDFMRAKLQYEKGRPARSLSPRQCSDMRDTCVRVWSYSAQSGTE